MDIDKLLEKKGLKFEQLTAEEQETLNSWMQSLHKNEVNVAVIRDYIAKMRDSVSQAMTELQETPTTWLSLFGLFFPLVGIIRKWYLDQKRVALTARFRNYVLLEALLSTPEKAQMAIEKAVDGLGKSRG